MENTLYYGDNLEVLRLHIPDESIDLVYLDPPFNSNQNYNVLFKEKNGSQAASQIRAFEDTWSWCQDDEVVFADLVTKGGKVADVMQAFRAFLGPCDMLAYLVMMAPRLCELRRVMKPTANIYLHCDPTASHYLKMLMDAVFGPRSFRNEIIWHYRRWTATSGRFQKLHDVLLYFGKTQQPKFNVQYEPYGDWILKDYGYTDEQGRRWRWHTVKGQRYKVYLKDEKQGVKLGDVWQIPFIGSTAKERLGYPTQKPEALLERIIKASSNEGDVVLDPFCGCGTTIATAQKLNRQWIGIDITHLAITLIKTRLNDAFGDKVSYKVIGEPVSIPDAAALAKSDPYQFQWWADGLVGARPVEQKKGADKGIDGKIIFQGEGPGKFENIIISVKAGHVTVSHVRDLLGVLDREKAAIGVLISMEDPTKPMQTEAVTAGFFESKTWERKYPKVQLLTVADLLAGKKIEMPPIKQVGVTFKKAEKYKGEKAEQLVLSEKK